MGGRRTRKNNKKAENADGTLTPDEREVAVKGLMDAADEFIDKRNSGDNGEESQSDKENGNEMTATKNNAPKRQAARLASSNKNYDEHADLEDEDELPFEAEPKKPKKKQNSQKKFGF